jgi:sigma-B regulation protein RsbU (phosphoserine phosphatase)
MATVLLSAPPGTGAEDLRRLLAAAGFAVSDHALGAAPAVDFAPVAVAVLDAADRADVAAAQTRRWRAELGDEFVPVLWIAPPELAPAALDAGADAVVPRGAAPAALVAQVRTMARARAAAGRVAARATESRLLGDQLRRTVAQLEREQEMARRVRQNLIPQRLPRVAAARFDACYRPMSRAGGDFHDVRRLDEHHVGFFVGDVVGTGTAAGGLIGVFAQQAVTMKEIGEKSYRLVPPRDVLTGVNRQLLGLGGDDLPLVAMAVGLLNARTGAVALARAGLPPAVFVPANGPPVAWAVPGGFLGVADTPYEQLNATLAPGDRLLLGTDGTRPDGDPGPDATDRLLAAAARHRGAPGAEFLDAVARDLLAHVRHPDDFTLLGVEMAAE